ncbi:MAG: MoaD/ThiS family protein [Methanospirillum sp.]|nr:MoaD/ThiS family protein [Methanospirillum sp.]
MTARVRFFAQFRERYGAELRIETPPGATVTGVVQEAAGSDRGEESVIGEDGSLRDYVILMKNGRRVEHDEARQTPAEDGDEIAVFPPVAGG